MAGTAASAACGRGNASGRSPSPHPPSHRDGTRAARRWRATRACGGGEGGQGVIDPAVRKRSRAIREPTHRRGQKGRYSHDAHDDDRVGKLWGGLSGQAARRWRRRSPSWCVLNGDLEYERVGAITRHGHINMRPCHARVIAGIGYDWASHATWLLCWKGRRWVRLPAQLGGSTSR